MECLEVLSTVWEIVDLNFKIELSLSHTSTYTHTAHKRTQKYMNVSASFDSVCSGGGGSDEGDGGGGGGGVYDVVLQSILISLDSFASNGNECGVLIGASFWKLLEFAHILFDESRWEGLVVVQKVINGFDTKRKYFANISRLPNLMIE